MFNNIYEVFNELSLNEEEFNSIDENLTDLEKKKIKINVRKKASKSRNKYIKAAVASLICISVIGTLIVKPAFADAIIENNPFLDAIYEKLGYYKDYKDFSQYIGISKESGGYKFTIDKLVADEDTVLVGIRINKKDLNKNIDNQQENGFMMTADVSSFSKHIIDRGGSTETKLDEDNTLVLLENDAAPHKKLPKRFDMKINLHHMSDDKVNVNFDLDVSREKIEHETIIKKTLGESSIGSDYNVKFQQIKVSPINTKITYSFNKPLSKDEYISFYAYDDKGQIYRWLNSGSDSSGYSTTTFKSLEKNTEKIYIVPCIAKNGNMISDAEYKSLDFYNKKYTLDIKRKFDFKECGEVNVYNIEKTGNKLKLYYSLQGELSKAADYTPVWLEVKKASLNDSGMLDYINYNNIKKYKLGSTDNYCLEYDDLNPGIEYAYTINIPGNKSIEGTPLEVNLK